MADHRFQRGPAVGGGWLKVTMYIVYIIQNQETKGYYVGYTEDLQDRLRRHNQGRNTSTKSSGKWVIVHTEEFSDKVNAWKRERQIKKYKGGEAFKKLVKQ